MTSIVSFIERNVMWLAVVVCLVLVLLVQTVRLEGFKVWPIDYEGAKPKAERLQAVIDDIEKAQEQALARAQAVKDAAELRYRTLAERTDDEIEQANADAMDAAERYIANNRVRCPTNRGASGGTVAASDDRGARVPESVPADTLVSITDSDLRACVGAVTYAVGAHNWALGLGEEQ